jgi:predicted nucleic acid-binding protein
VIVADTNLISYLLIEGEQTNSARRVWEIDPHWKMPPLWRSEFLSVLATTARVGIIEETQAISLWRNAVSIFSRCEQEPDGEQVLCFALKYKISAYDAQFIVLAYDLSIPLVTADKKLRHACPDLTVSLEKFASEG